MSRTQSTGVSRPVITMTLALVLAVLPAPDTGARAQESRDALPGWLAGCWLMVGPAGTYEEHWMAPRGGLMLGVGRSVRQGVAREFEHLRVEARGTGLVYVAHPSGQVPVEFQAAGLSDTLVVFENLQHEFPQRISYRMRGADSLVARVEGESGGRARSADFPMERTSCPGGADRGAPGAGDDPSGEKGSSSFPVLDRETASLFAALALRGITREYPNKLDHVMNGPEDVLEPSDLHPVFYGSYDWHSCVHGHWMLVRLLRLFPDLPQAKEIRATLGELITAEGVEGELAYLEQPQRASFERTYGWAWLLKLQEELLGWDDPDARRWSETLDPLARAFVERYRDFLPKQAYPIRRGVHPNTAFGIAFALDYARLAGDSLFEELLVERALAYFGGDRRYPARWEPDGDDFFSRSLMEADLMRRVLPGREFQRWFKAFLPDLENGEPAALLTPADVSDRTDPKIVHLDGLNLSRAWCMRLVASALSEEDPVRSILLDSAALHARATLPHIASGSYAGEHWLATFAVYMLTEGEPGGLWNGRFPG